MQPSIRQGIRYALVLLVLAAPALADVRPQFQVQHGEGADIRAAIWDSFDAGQEYVMVVIQWPYWTEWCCERCSGPRQFKRIWVRNPGWHGFRGDKAELEMVGEMRLLRVNTTVSR